MILNKHDFYLQLIVYWKQNILPINITYSFCFIKNDFVRRTDFKLLTT